MKLLFVSTWWPYPPDNGSRMRAYHLLRQLSKRHVITLIAFGRNGSPAHDAGDLNAFCERIDVVQRPVLPNDSLGTRGLLSRVPRYYAQVHSDDMSALVSRACAQHDAAVALQIDAAPYLAGRRRLPRVFDEVEVSTVRDRVDSAPSLPKRLRHSLTWLKHSRYVRELVNSFDAATVVSTAEYAALTSLGVDPSRVSVVPNGVEVGMESDRVVRGERVIYPGSVVYSANLDAVRHFVHDIFPTVRRARPRLEFWVTGEVGVVDVADLQRPGVVFTGYVPNVERLIAESAACVVPLRIGGGTRLKVLQAMALGTPVVSTSKGIEGLALESDQHVLVADAPEAFALSVLHVLTHPVAARDIAHRAHRRVRERYAWTTAAEVLEGVIDRVVIRFRSRSESEAGRMCGAV